MRTLVRPRDVISAVVRMHRKASWLASVPGHVRGFASLLLLVGLVTACAGKRDTINSPVECTDETKVCDDGSSVGRTGPFCEFDACPGSAEPVQPVSGNPCGEGGDCPKDDCAGDDCPSL